MTRRRDAQLVVVSFKIEADVHQALLAWAERNQVLIGEPPRPNVSEALRLLLGNALVEHGELVARKMKEEGYHAGVRIGKHEVHEALKGK